MISYSAEKTLKFPFPVEPFLLIWKHEIVKVSACVLLRVALTQHFFLI